jgi:hypothetical protein
LIDHACDSIVAILAEIATPARVTISDLFGIALQAFGIRFLGLPPPRTDFLPSAAFLSAAARRPGRASDGCHIASLRPIHRIYLQQMML